jgi:hypothetical protein
MGKDFITWTPEKFTAFDKAYKKALKDGKEQFVFEDRDFVTGYAKYLIEYLAGQFKPSK